MIVAFEDVVPICGHADPIVVVAIEGNVVRVRPGINENIIEEFRLCPS